MRHHMSSRQRKSGKSSDKERKQQKDRNCSIHISSTLACLHYNTVANLMLLLHTGLPILPTTHHRKYLLDQATTTMGSRVVHLVQIVTLLAETRAGVIIRAEEVTAAADHIINKDGELLMLAVGLEGLMVVPTGLDRLTTHKVVSMVALGEVRTQWVVVETSNTDGNSRKPCVICLKS